jgi:glycosyltransferase involved in cell wall biosynthesis
MTSDDLHVALFSPANLNVMDGSAIWVQSVAETLHAGPRVHVTLPLRAPVTRGVISGLLSRLERVDVIDPRAVGFGSPDGLGHEAALDLLERLDRERGFDALLLRSFDVCLKAIERPHIRDRVFACYIVEPERDIESTEYRTDLDRIARAVKYVVAQSEEMRALTESLVPAARGKTILLPPAIPAQPAARAPIDQPVPRMIYTGKFHPFYQVERLIEFLGSVRADIPEMALHVVGDKIFRSREMPTYASDLRRSFRTTKGVVWHGAISRDDVESLLSHGGIALSLWDYRHGSTMNDLVVSTKLLDYCSVGLPVVLNRTAAQEAMLGPDYPLFVTRTEDALPLIRRLLRDPALYRLAADRCFESSRQFTYPRVYERFAPYLEPDRQASAVRASFDRPKLPGCMFNVGLVAQARTDGRIVDAALDLLAGLRAADDRFRLLVRDLPEATRVEAAKRLDANPSLATAVSFEPAADHLETWLRTVGFLLVGGDFSSLLDDDRTASVLASGTVPVVLDGVAHAPSSTARARATRAMAVPPGSVTADTIARLVLGGEWPDRSAQAREIGRAAAAAL